MDEALASSGPEPYHYWNATFRCENGPEIAIGIRRKNGKAEPSETDPQKPTLKIDINEFVPGQVFSGKIKLDLENGGDSSGGTSDNGSENGLREGSSWFLMNEVEVVASRVAWVNIWINGDFKGLYTHVEQVDKPFLVDHGIDEGGWLFKGPSNEQRTREGEPNPFYFNWYPFDHVSPEEPQPADWHDQTPQRVDMPQLLTLVATTNFIANKDGVVFKDNNYWYYDWSVFPGGQQPRLYLPWDLDTTLKKTDEEILGRPHNNGHMAQALLRDDPLFQAQHYQTYNDLLDGPLSLASTQAYLDTLEPILSPHINADPNQTVGSALDQFQMVRDFLVARTTFVTHAFGNCPDGTCDTSETECTCPADCGIPPTSESVCSDLTDDDCDGPIDCADADCALDPVCEEVPAPNTLLIAEIVANSPGGPGEVFVHGYTFGPQGEKIPFGYVPQDSDAPEHIVVPTPGLNNGLSAARSPICINEFLATSQSGGIDDWIELFNRGNADVDIGGWHLSDSASTPDKYRFPAAAIIPAGGFMLIDETELGFSLNSTGSEVIVLTHADGETGQDYFDYGLQFPDVTRGRFPDGAPYWASFASPSPGTCNGCIVENLEFVLPTELVWDAFPGTPRYDIVQGELDLLRSSSGDYSQAITGCLDNDRTQTNWGDMKTPSAGTAVFYLVRVVDTECPVGTYDSLSTRQWSRRDESIAGAAAACP